MVSATSGPPSANTGRADLGTNPVAGPAPAGGDRRGARRGWQHTVGTDLLGSTLGLIGLGRIGRQMTRIAHGFGMDVVAWSQTSTTRRPRRRAPARSARSTCSPPRMWSAFT